MSLKYLSMGKIPYENPDYASRMIEKLFNKNPALFMLPKISGDDSIEKYTLDNFPCVKYRDDKYVMKTQTTVSVSAMKELEEIYNNPTPENLEKFAFNTVFLKTFLKIIKTRKSEHATFNLLGPYTISQLVHSLDKDMESTIIIMNKVYRKILIQTICVKALWLISKIKTANPNTTPIVILEEPKLNHVGNMKREDEDFSEDILVSMYSKIIEKLKEAGAIVGIHSSEKCDWQIPINAGIDIISFDAYNNPNNLCIIPDAITEFLERGGKINWAIVPVLSESLIKSINLDYIKTRLVNTMQALIASGISETLVYRSALVSVQGSTDHLPIIIAEKALMLSSQLSKKISA